jgi:hypothetical protein
MKTKTKEIEKKEKKKDYLSATGIFRFRFQCLFCSHSLMLNRLNLFSVTIVDFEGFESEFVAGVSSLPPSEETFPSTVTVVDYSFDNGGEPHLKNPKPSQSLSMSSRYDSVSVSNRLHCRCRV